MAQLAIKSSVSNLTITKNKGYFVAGKADKSVNGEVYEIEFEADVAVINLDLSGTSPVCDGEIIEVTGVFGDYEGSDFDEITMDIMPELTNLIACEI